MVSYAGTQKQLLVKIVDVSRMKRKIISNKTSSISLAFLLISIQALALLLLRAPVLHSQDYYGKQ